VLAVLLACAALGGGLVVGSASGEPTQAQELFRERLLDARAVSRDVKTRWAPMRSTIRSDSAAAGSRSTRRFQWLVAGKMPHRGARVSGLPSAPPPDTARPAAVVRAARSAATGRRLPQGFADPCDHSTTAPNRPGGLSYGG
jgi:hypothetical protein